jgi:hypothetical protein
MCVKAVGGANKTPTPLHNRFWWRIERSTVLPLTARPFLRRCAVTLQPQRASQGQLLLPLQTTANRFVQLRRATMSVELSACDLSQTAHRATLSPHFDVEVLI